MYFVKTQVHDRNVTTGATGTTMVASAKFSDTLTLSQPGGGGADSAHHRRGRT